MKARKIGIIGGTFNPIHYAHLLIAENAREQFGLDRVIFIPTGISYMKQDNEIPSGDIRYQMVKIAIEGNPYFTCSRIEMDREGYTYTVDTLKELQKMYPGDKLYFIMGEDSLRNLDTWHDYEEIFKLATILVTKRRNDDTSEIKKLISDFTKNNKAHIKEIISSEMEISSSVIRKKISSGKSVRYLLPEDVAEYIAVKNLYSPSSIKNSINEEGEENERLRIWF